jgi:hypothetical protein
MDALSPKLGSAIPLIQLEGAGAARHPKVPMMTPDAPGQHSLASNDETALAAFL